MKVRANTVYTYRPVGYDLYDPKSTAKRGDKVRVVNLPGCPKANTMGHCHIEDPETGAFLGLVQTASLSKE